LIDMIEQHVAKNSVDVSSGFCLSPILEFDPKTERFVGQDEQLANRFLKRKYRPQFEVPAIA
jgi:hypothetical protein